MAKGSAVSIRVDEAVCCGCGACAQACQVNAITLVGDKPVILEGLCTGCLSCVEACPQGALAVAEKPELVPAQSWLTTGAETNRDVTRAGRSPWLDLADKMLMLFVRELAPRIADALARRLNWQRPVAVPTERGSTVEGSTLSQPGLDVRRRRCRRGQATSRPGLRAGRLRSEW
jgi:Fe-S-cluster-containing hydrogenase component 2